MIDINYHLITESGFPPPTDYYQSFLQLERLGILPHDLLRWSLRARLRNRIVHGCEIDPPESTERFRPAHDVTPKPRSWLHEASLATRLRYTASVLEEESVCE
jgi:hypothetical protein